MGGQRVVIPNAMLFAEALVNRSAYGSQLVKLRVTLPVAGPQDGQAGTDQPHDQEQRESPADTLRAALRAAGGRMEPATQPEPVGETAPAGPAGAAGTPALGAGSEPAVMVESLTADKVTLRAEVWASDARTAAARLAWALRECLPRAEITVLE